MKLFALPSAFLHDNEDSSKLHIHCNPISMVDGQRENFKVVKDLAYEETVNLTDIEASCKAFTRFINTWEIVIKRQERSLGAESREELKDLAEKLPIAFIAGDAEFNQIDLNALSLLLSGQKISDKSKNFDGLSDSERAEFRTLPSKILRKYKNSENLDYELAKARAHDPDVGRYYELMHKIFNRGPSLVEKITVAREAYLKKHDTYPPEFIEACGKLPRLLERSWYNHARFSNSGSSVFGEPDFTQEIKSLEQPYREGKPEAFERLKHIAAELGEHYGKEFTRGIKVFKLDKPKNFDKDPELQKKHPELTFFKWPDSRGNFPFASAFHDAFENANWHPNFRHMNIGPDNPLYADPAADMMVMLHQIALGKRAWFSIEQSHAEPNHRDDFDSKSLVSELAEHEHRSGQKKHADHLSRAGKNDPMGATKAERY